MKNILKITTLIIFCALTFSGHAQVKVVGVPTFLNQESTHAMLLKNQYIDINKEYTGDKATGLSEAFLKNFKDTIALNTGRWPLVDNKSAAELLISLNAKYDAPKYEILNEDTGVSGTYKIVFITTGTAAINLKHTDMKTGDVFFEKSDQFDASRRYDISFKNESAFKEFILADKWKRYIYKELEKRISQQIFYDYYQPYNCVNLKSYLISLIVGKKKKEEYKEVLKGYDILKKVTEKRLRLEKLDANTILEIKKSITIFKNFIDNYDPSQKKKLFDKINYHAILVDCGIAHILLLDFEHAFDILIKDYYTVRGNPESQRETFDKIDFLMKVKFLYAGTEYLKQQAGGKLSDKYNDIYLMKEIFVNGGGTITYRDNTIVHDDSLGIKTVKRKLTGKNGKQYDLSQISKVSFLDGQINFIVKQFKKKNKLVSRINSEKEKIALFVGSDNGYIHGDLSYSIDYYADIPGQNELKKINSLSGGGTKPLLKKEAENCDWLKKVIKEKNRKYVVSLGGYPILKPYFWINMAKGYTENCK